MPSSPPKRTLTALPLPVVRPIPARSLVAGLSVIMLASAVFSYHMQVPRREHVQGWLEPAGGEIRIMAPQAGVLTKLAQPGAVLEKGTSVAVLEDPRGLEGPTVSERQVKALEEGQQALSEAASAREAEQASQVTGLQAQIRLAQASFEQAKAEVFSREEAAKLQLHELARTEQLVASGFLAPGKLEQLQSAQRVLDAQVSSAKRSAQQAQAQVISLRTELAQSIEKAAQDLALNQRQQADLSVQKASVEGSAKGRLLTAQAATVLATAATEGSSVSEGQLIAVLSPKGAQLKAVLLVPSKAAGRIQPGQTVQLRMAAYPYETHGAVIGVIERIDDTPLNAQDSVLLRHAESGTSYVRAIATVSGFEFPRTTAALKSGMQFEASIEVDRRSLLGWVIWPLVKNFK